MTPRATLDLLISVNSTARLNTATISAMVLNFDHFNLFISLLFCFSLPAKAQSICADYPRLSYYNHLSRLWLLVRIPEIQQLRRGEFIQAGPVNLKQTFAADA